FYAVMPHGTMVTLFGAVFLFVIAALVMSWIRFWPDTGEEALEFVQPQPFTNATWDTMGLRYLDGGGDGCTYPDAKPSFARRNFHHLTFHGFLLCFAATVVATVFHYVFGGRAPFPFYSLRVILGVIGGIGLLIGPAGLLWLKLARDPQLADRTQTGMDAAFI